MKEIVKEEFIKVPIVNTVYEEKLEKIKYFVAEDGKEFKNKRDCQWYELQVNDKKFKQIKCFDTDFSFNQIFILQNDEEVEIFKKHELNGNYCDIYFNSDFIDCSKKEIEEYLNLKNYPILIGYRFYSGGDSGDEYFFYSKEYILKQIDELNIFISDIK